MLKAAFRSRATLSLDCRFSSPSVSRPRVRNFSDKHNARAFRINANDYSLSEDHLSALDKLSLNMKSTGTAYTVVSITNILLSAFQASGYGEGEEGEVLVAEGSKAAAVVLEGLTIGDLAYWADSLILVLLISFSLSSFEKIRQPNGQGQITSLWRGLVRLELVFEQLAIGSFAVTTVTALEAAVKYPPIVVFAASSFFSLALIRACAMSYVLNAHTSDSEEISRTLRVVRDAVQGNQSQAQSFVDNVAVWLAFGFLVGFEDRERQDEKKGKHVDASVTDGSSHPRYEFSASEERTLKSMTQSTSAAGLAILLQSFSTYVLAAAEFGAGDYPGVLSNGINATNKLLMALLVFQACGSFDRALHTDNGEDDLSHLMEGMGEHGLTEFFSKLQILAWATSFAQLLGIFLPWIEHNIIGTLTADGSSHAAAEAVVEGLEEGIKLLEKL